MQERLSLGRGQAKRGGRASERRAPKPSQVDLVRARAHSFGGTDIHFYTPVEVYRALTLDTAHVIRKVQTFSILCPTGTACVCVPDNR